VAEAVDQAERERELTKQALASDIDRLESRIRTELDWKARLRRDGVKLAIVGGVVVVAAVGVIVLRRSLKRDEPVAAAPSNFQEMAAELATIRRQLDKAKIEPDAGPVWQKIAVKAVTAAAGAGGTYAARRFMSRVAENGAGSSAPA
jgi:hypothetical protein